MDKEFSWVAIHPEGNKYSLYLYNKKGLIKRLFSNSDLEIVQQHMKRKQELNKRITKALSEAVEKAMNDPEVFKRLQKH